MGISTSMYKSKTVSHRNFFMLADTRVARRLRRHIPATLRYSAATGLISVGVRDLLHLIFWENNHE